MLQCACAQVACEKYGGQINTSLKSHQGYPFLGLDIVIRDSVKARFVIFLNN